MGWEVKSVVMIAFYGILFKEMFAQMHKLVSSPTNQSSSPLYAVGVSVGSVRTKNQGFAAVPTNCVIEVSNHVL